jgi:molecular chaperone GrpE
MDKNKNKQNEQITNLENQLKKALADYTNLERDLDRRIELRSIQLKMQIARNIFSVIDAMELAVTAKDSLKLEGETLAWADGIVAIISQAQKSLEDLGITKMDIKPGDDYNSSSHEALSMVNEGEKGKIYQVVGSGYMLGEFVVRPARVIVANGKA